MASSKGNSLPHTSAPQGRGRTLVSLPSWQEKLMWERGKHGFPEQRRIGDGVRIWKWVYEATTLKAISCFLEFFQWPFCPVLFFPLVKTRKCHTQTAIYRKENTFEVPFTQWKFLVPHQGSKVKREPIALSAIFIGEFYLGYKPEFISWAKSQWACCTFTVLMVGWNRESFKLLVVVFVKWLFCPCCRN